MKYTMKEILASYTKDKRRESSLWARVFSRPLSFPLTYIFINLGFSADVMSVISMVEVIAACAVILVGGEFTRIGIFMYVMWHVLDCCDGNIARVKKTSTYAGEFFDAVSGYLPPALIFLCIGVTAFRTTALPADKSYWLIVLGAIASISDILGRLIYQKYLVTEYRLDLIGKSGDIDQVRRIGFYHVIDVIMRTMTYSCAFMPLLILSAVFNQYDLLIFVFAVYNFAFMLASAVFFVKKAYSLNSRLSAKTK